MIANDTQTVVATHDTQPEQALALPLKKWFLPHAYALTLLRACASTPCVFSGHLHGLAGPEPQEKLECLPALMKVRKSCAYGTQYNYFDEPNCVGWTRVGRGGQGEGCAVVLNIANEADMKRMWAGQDKGGWSFVDVISGKTVTVGEDGWTNFEVGARSAAVFVPEGVI